MHQASFALAATLVLVAPAIAAGPQWESGWGMGITEAWIELDPANRIDVACTGGYGRPIANVAFTLGGKTPPANSLVTVTVDGGKPMEVPMGDDGTLRSDSNFEARWFDAVIEALKFGQLAVVAYDGAIAAFPLAGSAEAIGDCPADYWRTDLDR